MAGFELYEAFVELRVGTAKLARDVEKGLNEGTAASSVTAGEQAGTGFAGGFKAKAGATFKSAVGELSKIGVATLGAVGVASIKMAADFQEGLTTLVTGAGESERNLKMVGEGIKTIAVTSGTSTAELIKGMYMIESAGYHGSAGLRVLQAAAEGAKVGNADLGAVANAVTTVMTDYALKGPAAAADATNALVAVTARGKTHLQDLATSMARVLPTAAALGVSMGQVGGALATMTGEGTSARLAAMGLNATLLAMAAPSSKASKAMGDLGLSSKTVADTLTHQGLVAALDLVSQAAEKAGPRGSPAYVAAMKEMLGGTNGLRVGLQLTGTHMQALIGNTAAVNAAMHSGKDGVKGWELAQKDFNVQLDIFKARLEVAGITLGQKLLPVLSTALGFLIRTHLLFPAIIALMGVLTAAIVAQAVAWQLTPVGWIADGIVAIVAALVLLKKAWDDSSGFREWMYGFAIGVLDDAKVIVGAFKFIVDAFLSFVGTILHGAADAFGWIPGIGGKLKTADKAFHDFHSSVDDHLNGMMNTMTKWQQKLQGAIDQSKTAGDKITADFARQGKAAQDAKGQLDIYTKAVTDHGTKSEQARPPRQHLIDDLTKAGLNATIAKKDVNDYTTAVQEHGVKSDAARAARQRLIADITSVWNNSQQGKTDIDKLTAAIRNASSTSDQVQSARQRLINDLINAGLDAKDAHSYVDGLTDAINHMPKNPTTVLHLKGVGTIAINASGAYIQGESGHIVAAGTGYAGGTAGAAPGWAWVGERGPELAHFWGGETIIPNHAIGALPGYAAGAGIGTPFSYTPAAANKWMTQQAQAMEGKFATGAAKTFEQGYEKALIKALSLGGPAIVAWALQWQGRIPYVWGGTAIPGGCDCSGFTGTAYAHFGINAPRTSEAQGAWVRRTPPEPGGLAFYHSPAGGADPGHVAMVIDASTVLSQGGGMGPNLMGIHDMPLLWTGIPPGGFSGLARTAASVGGFGGNGGTGDVRAWLLASLATTGEPASWLPYLTWMVGAESGGNPRAFNPSGASGLLQMKPGTYAAFATLAGGIWDPISNAAAAERYIAARYGAPWNIPGVESSGYRGYAGGGRIPEDVLGIGRSGAGYLFHGGEVVTPLGGAQPVDTGLEAHLGQIAQLLAEVPGETADGIADILNGIGRRAVRSNAYSVGAYG